MLDILKDINLPTTIGSWADDEVVPSSPFIEYHRDDRNDLVADDKVSIKRTYWALSVYGQQKSTPAYYEAVEKVEQVLDSHNVVYTASGDIFDDNIVYTTYYFTK